MLVPSKFSDIIIEQHCFYSIGCMNLRVVVAFIDSDYSRTSHSSSFLGEILSCLYLFLLKPSFAAISD